MDDFVLTNLQESRNEWCSRLVSVFCPLVIEGMKSIFNEAWKICNDTNEPAKYLMTFQNFLSRVPKWNSVIIEEERKRIIERSGCNYLEDLITCVHIIQLKVLTCIRVGNKQKQIDITIPKLDHFIHKVYIQVARKLYTNIYLFEKNISPLQMQKNGRELEIIVQECILTTIRESIPTEEIIRAYMDESVEHEEEVTIEPFAEPVLEKKDVDAEESGVSEPIKKELPRLENDKPIIKDLDTKEVVTQVSFQELDDILEKVDNERAATDNVTIERLSDMSVSNALQNQLDEDNIQIHTDNLDIGDLGITDVGSEQSMGVKGETIHKVSDDVLDLDSLGIESIA